MMTMLFRLVLLITIFVNLFSYGRGHCRLVSGSSNYCNSYNCYLYSNATGDVGEMLNHCASYYSIQYIRIYFNGIINIDLSITSSNVPRLTFYIFQDSTVYINASVVNQYLTSLSFYYKSYHFRQTDFLSNFPNLRSFYSTAFLDFDYPQTFTRLTQLTRVYVNPPTGSLTWKFELTNDAFRGLTSLKSIHLVRADITDIRYAFHGLTQLYNLELEGNKIAKLEPDIFKDMKSLTSLDLDGNGIKEVSNDALNGLTALKSLSLSGNPFFPLHILCKLNSLTTLQINYNSYRTLPPEPFEQLASLSTVYADNPFFCDCSLRWTSVVSQYSLSIQSAYCLEPGKVYRTPITSPTLYTNCTENESYNCFSKTAICPTDYVCRDTASSYACTCADGFSLLSTGECTDEDECQRTPPLCEHHCNNTIGSYECYCDIGYQLSADDRSCEDVDECDIGTGQCINGEVCVNTIGNYACREYGCVQSCNNPQDHSCTCCNGYRLYNNSQCIDIDECEESIDECDMNCQNTNGSYQCSCNAGFQLVNQTKCLDIDECLVENGGCHGLCMNTNGSHYCFDFNISTIESFKCNEDGYSQSCHDPLHNECTCCTGYRMSNDSKCVDVNECEESICDMNCHNMKGSYHCSCEEGFQLLDGNKCLDIDECLTNNGGCQGVCINSKGSYYCLNINISTIESYECDEFGYPKSCTVEQDPSCSCCPGYEMRNSICVDIDECKDKSNLCEMKCRNSKGSYSCSCNEGFQLINNDMCLDVDECLTNNGGCEHSCKNSNGSFTCLSTNSSGDVNTYLLVILVILVIVLISILIVLFIGFVILRSRMKKNSYQAVFQPIPATRESVYEVPSQDFNENAAFLEKVNTNDTISEGSTELYPAPIADVQPIN